MSTSDTIRVHRIVKPRFETSAWSGEGASRYGGRWNHPGTPCIYCGSTMSLAAIELLVHLEAADVLNAYSTAWIELEVSQVRDVAADDLPVGWDSEPATHASRDLGTHWLEAGETVGLRVPSAVVRVEQNVLLNPRHPDFARLKIAEFESFHFDPRLNKTPRSA